MEEKLDDVALYGAIIVLVYILFFSEVDAVLPLIAFFVSTIYILFFRKK